MPEQGPLFDHPEQRRLPAALEDNLRSINPWWRNEPGPAIPSYRRAAFRKLRALVQEGITPATCVRGPRRVGKTVLLRQIIDSLLADRVAPQRILYAPFDDLPTVERMDEPLLAIARWFERAMLGRTFNAAARAGQPAFLVLDEVQNLEAWDAQLKSLVDNHTLRVLVTGSSSLRIAEGRDSLAGRITTLELGPLLLREIAELRLGASVAPCWPDNGLDALTRPELWRDAAASATDLELRRAAFTAFSARGAYPVVHEQPDRRWAVGAANLAVARGFSWAGAELCRGTRHVPSGSGGPDNIAGGLIWRRASAAATIRLPAAVRDASRSRTTSTRPSSSGRSSTISAWDRGGASATSACSRRCSSSAAAMPARHRGRAC